jgi:cytochrome c-type biogenesis protein CcmH
VPEVVRRFLGTAITVLLLGIVVWGLVVGQPSGDRVSQLGSRIKCPVCQGESITDSPAGYARDILAYVEARVEEGWTDEQIIEHLEGNFPGIRLDPQFSGTTAILWILPVAVLVGGVAVAAGRTRSPDTTEAGS